ncbi:hypothetical protein, partial [Pseudomonas sp. SDO55104_S430]
MDIGLERPVRLLPAGRFGNRHIRTSVGAATNSDGCFNTITRNTAKPVGTRLTREGGVSGKADVTDLAP